MLPSGTDKSADSATSYATRRHSVVSFTLGPAYSRSMTVTFAVPPPSHIVCSP